MDKISKEQYMETLRIKYFKGDKKEKTKILNEYCGNTKEDRKHAIKKFNCKIKTKKAGERKKRKEYYDSYVKSALVDIWNIFDRPCGQRMKPVIDSELNKLIELKEIQCGEKTKEKLQKITSATIDRKLKHEKEVLKLNLKYSTKKKDLVLLNQVPVKTSVDLDRKIIGNIQLDCVEHCGGSVSGQYANTLTAVDIFSGWCENEAFLGKGQERTLIGIDNARNRSPFVWTEIHPDNGLNLLNWHVCKYAGKENIKYSRSRPYMKNDNCFVEQKNSTHVRKPFGYLRYDTRTEINILNDLYRNELRLYKNFFQPVMKLKEKLRVKGKIHRKYDEAKTPYRRLIESNQIGKETKQELAEIYESLNPAELKRNIDKKIKNLYAVYSKKKDLSKVEIDRKLAVNLMSFSMIHR